VVTGSWDDTARIWYDTRAENHGAARQEAALALACALHPRLGESSPAQLLDTYVLRDIMELAGPESFGPIEQTYKIPNNPIQAPAITFSDFIRKTACKCIIS
jgi:hypothetical protein